MKTVGILRAAACVVSLTLPLTGASAVAFTADTHIPDGDATYDGQDITVSNCTLTVDGPHGFASISVVSNGVITHSAAPNGEADNRLDLTIDGDVTVDATSRIDADGRGYGPTMGPGAAPAQDGRACGAGHGGLGGWSSTGAGTPGGAYGSIDEPTMPGSGGGTASGAPGGVRGRCDRDDGRRNTDFGGPHFGRRRHRGGRLLRRGRRIGRQRLDRLRQLGRQRDDQRKRRFSL